MDPVTHKAIFQAVAKAIAYKACGKHDRANEWARILVRLLECAEILKETE
jgi:hypothetical protein